MRRLEDLHHHPQVLEPLLPRRPRLAVLLHARGEVVHLTREVVHLTEADLLHLMLVLTLLAAGPQAQAAVAEGGVELDPAVGAVDPVPPALRAAVAGRAGGHHAGGEA